MDMPINDELTIIEAVDFVNANLAVIGNAARLHNPAALDVVSCYGSYAREPHIVTADDLVSAVYGWLEYCADNPKAEL